MHKLLLTVALVFSASMTSAMCNRDHQSAMSCAEGSTFDAATGTCVPIVNS